MVIDDIPSVFPPNVFLKRLPDRASGFYVDVLETIALSFNILALQHRLVFAMRISITLPDWLEPPESNSFFQIFTDIFIQELCDKGYDPRFVWIRDFPTHPTLPLPIQYQLLLMTNGAIPQSADDHIATAVRLLATMLQDSDPTNYFPQLHKTPIECNWTSYPDGILVDSQANGSSQAFAEIFTSVSDLAIRRGRSYKNRPAGCLEYGRSNLPDSAPILRALIC